MRRGNAEPEESNQGNRYGDVLVGGRHGKDILKSGKPRKRGNQKQNLRFK